MRTASARALGGCLALVMLAALAACTDDSSSGGSQPPQTSAPTDSPTPPVDLSFGVYGSTEEVAAYAKMAHHFDTVNDHADVTIIHWSSHDGLQHSVEQGDPLPDVFLVSRRDLRWFTERQLTRPVDTLLDERGVDLGDLYARGAVTAFSSDNRLQCMPYGVEPDVIFYNEDLIDFTKMANRGLDAPTDHRRWSWDQFLAAATFATRPNRGIKGFAVDQTLTGLAPFIYAGGGDLFDDDSEPTSLAFSGDGTTGALNDVLPLFRDQKLTLTPDQLAERSPTEWFEQGKLGMIVGTRSLVPELRKVPGLRFDVMPIPSIESTATVGEITGLCISQKAESPATAADFLVYATGADAVTEVTRDGYLQPANQQVALAEAFLQPTKLPLSASVFNEAVGHMVIPPLLDTWDQLEPAVAPFLQELFYSPSPLDLAPITQAIDQASQPILSPETATPTTSPTASPGSTPTDSPSP